MYKSACHIASCAWLTGFQKGMPLCSMGVFSGGVPLRQENALLSYGFSVQNSHWSRNRLHAQGCASLPRWNSPLNRLYLVYRLFGFHSAQIVVQVVVLTVQVGGIPHTIAEGSLDGMRCLPPCFIVVEQTTDALVAMECINCLVHVACGVEYHIILRIQ